MEILTSVRRLYIRFKSLVNDFVCSFGRAALLLLVEVQNHTVPVRERRRIRVNFSPTSKHLKPRNLSYWQRLTQMQNISHINKQKNKKHETAVLTEMLLEMVSLLRCYVMLTNSYRRLEDTLTLNMKTVRSFKIPITIYHSAQRNVPDDFSIPVNSTVVQIIRLISTHVLSSN